MLYPIGITQACAQAAKLLKRAGIPITDHPTPDATGLLLDIPSFRPGGPDVARILTMLPPDILVIGGNLDVEELSQKRKLDLLKNEEYLAANAAITADCALRLAGQHLEATFQDTPALILGWGRIGKCLSQKLAALGAPVTVAARKEKDRAMIRALDFEAAAYDKLDLRPYGLVFNTVPAPVLNRTQLDVFPECVKIELASRPGLEGAGIIDARGLPGKLAPQSSGALIARTILKEAVL